MITQPEKSQNRRVLLLFIPLVTLYLLSYFQRVALPGSIYNTLSAELSLSAAQMANLGVAFIYPYAFCQLISGVLIDRFCGTRVVIGGGIIFVIGVWIFPLVSDLGLLYSARIMAGIGASTMFLCLARETERFFGRKDYGMMFGIAYGCGYAGGMLGTLPFERLCSIYPWQNILLAAAVISTVAYILVLRFCKSIPLPAIPRSSFSLYPFYYVIKNPLTWQVMLCGNSVFCTYFIIQTFFGKKFLEDFAGFSSAGASAVIFGLTVTSVLTMLMTSFLVRFAGNRRRILVLISCGCCALGSILMVLAIVCRWPGWVFPPLYWMFAVAAGIAPIYTMLMQEMNAKEIAAQTTAFCNMAGYLLVAVIAQIFGHLLDAFERTVVNGHEVYAPEAYRMIFIIISVFSSAVFLLSLKVPETRGHYLHLHINKTPVYGGKKIC